MPVFTPGKEHEAHGDKMKQTMHRSRCRGARQMHGDLDLHAFFLQQANTRGRQCGLDSSKQQRAPCVIDLKHNFNAPIFWLLKGM